MSKIKISITIDERLMVFIEKYQLNYNISNRSEVIEKAVVLLREKILEQEYLEANEEIDHDLDAWCGDGLEDESW
jgi:metal-responsive CopG/Arc/MetJ family transcriptional regulator